MQLVVLSLLFGGLYVGPVLIALLVMLRVRGKRSSDTMEPGDVVLMLLPIAVYLALEYLVQMRQGFASWQAQGLLAVPGVITAVLSTYNPRRARVSVLATILAAVALWWFYPGQVGWRLF